MPPIIQVESVAKQYSVMDRPQQSSLRELLSNGIHLFRRKQPDITIPPTPKREPFWALDDVSFSVEPGERIGIVGRNGAGKSTLLKILSRITSPTRGRITIRGRVSSLLEVGTGFHPDLTGRENIYMNGAILGMTRSEIRRKFDAIVAFAEIERFLDTPVKRYSSGMAVRLAFAVAAHLEPEILIVDEVLAVGDAEFQRKCIGKMQDVSSEQGRTVLFVSHSMAAVQALCTKGILLRKGKIAFAGPVDQLVERYMQSSGSVALSEHAIPGADFDLLDLVADSEGGALQTFKPARIAVTFRTHRRLADAGVHVLIEDLLGSPILGLDSNDFVPKRIAEAGTELNCTFNIQSLPLSPGPLHLRVWLKSEVESLYWEVPRLFEINIEGGSIYGSRTIERQWHGHTSVVATAQM